MEFHHRDGEVKKFMLGGAMAQLSTLAALKRILEEIRKCDCLCCLCCRCRTYGQKRGVVQLERRRFWEPEMRGFESRLLDYWNVPVTQSVE